MNNKNFRIELAPLQGHTDACFRNAHEAIFGGISNYYTPFVRLEKGKSFRTRELRDINPDQNHVSSLIPQIIASNVEEMELLTQLMLDNGYNQIDLNMGCPFPMIARRHKGSGLLAFPEEVKPLLEYIQKQDQISFSVKMRLGWENPNECLALVEMLNDTPLRSIGLHARLGKQQYKGEPDLNGFAQFYEQCKHPLLYNGDILTIEDINTIKEKFPQIAGVMIGRGLLANPALAYEYTSLGETMPVAEKKRKMMQLHEELFSYYSGYLQGDKQILEKMKPFWTYLTKELEKKTRKKIEKANKLPHYEAAVAQAFSQWGKVVVIEEEELDTPEFIL